MRAVEGFVCLILLFMFVPQPIANALNYPYSDKRGSVSRNYMSIVLRNILSLLVCGLTVQSVCGQTKRDTVYQYRTCVIKDPTPGQLLSTRTVGIGDTVLAFVNGRIIMDMLESVKGATLTLTRIYDERVFTDSTDQEGKFEFFLPAGQYNLKVTHPDYRIFTLDSIMLASGQLQEFKISMGASYSFVTYLIKSEKPLTDKEAYQKAKELIEK